MAEVSPETGHTPAELGFSMPAEWEPHRATWLAWPHKKSDWPGKMETVRWVYTEIVRKLAASEQVALLVRDAAEARSARAYLRRARCDLGRVEFIVCPTDRSWTRDTGPIFVRRPGETAIVQFHFNAWARYPDWRKDRRVPERIARRLRKRLFRAFFEGRPVTLEGGGIEVNGKGTVITTEECYLHPSVQVRNPGLGRPELETVLRQYLGATNVFWLGSGITGDDTHGHVDDLCRFVNPRTLVMVREDDPSDANYRPLCENWERIQDLRLEDGSRPEVIPLPMPEPLFFEGYRLPASYANFYIANTVVLVPTFNDPADRVALGILAELFPGRVVVGIHAVDLVLGLGTLHCLTQQEPIG